MDTIFFLNSPPTKKRDFFLGIRKLGFSPLLLPGFLPDTMKKYETEIINRWLAKTNLEGAYVEKEVSVSCKVTDSDPIEEKLERIKSKRIDLIIKRDHCIEIYEVKPKLNASALGQLLVYSYLYKKNYMQKDARPVLLGVICEALDEEILEVFDSFRIKVIKV